MLRTSEVKRSTNAISVWTRESKHGIKFVNIRKIFCSRQVSYLKSQFCQRNLAPNSTIGVGRGTRIVFCSKTNLEPTRGKDRPKSKRRFEILLASFSKKTFCASQKHRQSAFFSTATSAFTPEACYDPAVTGSHFVAALYFLTPLVCA